MFSSTLVPTPTVRAYEIVNGQAVPVRRRSYDPTKPGMAQLINKMFPVSGVNERVDLPDAALSQYISHLQGLAMGEEWEHNDRVCRRMTVREVLQYCLDLQADRRAAMKNPAPVFTAEDRKYAAAMLEAITMSESVDA